MLDPGAAADKPLQQKGGASAGGSAGKGGASEGRWKNSRPYGQGPIRPQYLELQQHDDDCVGDDGNSALPTMLDSVWNNAQSMFFGYRSVSTNPHAPTVLSNDFGRMAQSGGEDDEEDGAFSRPPSTHGTYPMASWPKSVWGVSLPQFENAKEDVQPVERSIDHAAYRTPNVTAAMDAISGFTSQLSSSVFGQRQQTDRQPSHPVRAGAKSSLRQFDTRGAAGYGRSDIDQITSSSLHSVDLEESTL